MKRLLIVYHSQSGNTKKLVDWCLLGIQKEAIECVVKHALDTHFSDVKNADGIVFATPENFGTMSGMLKDFFDRTYDEARANSIYKPYVLLISCDTDGTGAERQLQTIANGYILKKALDTLIVKQDEQAQKKNAVIELGQTFATGISLGIF